MEQEGKIDSPDSHWQALRIRRMQRSIDAAVTKIDEVLDDTESGSATANVKRRLAKHAVQIYFIEPQTS